MVGDTSVGAFIARSGDCPTGERASISLLCTLSESALLDLADDIFRLIEQCDEVDLSSRLEEILLALDDAIIDYFIRHADN